MVTKSGFEGLWATAPCSSSSRLCTDESWAGCCSGQVRRPGLLVHTALAMALTWALAAFPGIAPAQIVINADGSNAPDRGSGGYDDDGANGGNGGSVAQVNAVGQAGVAASAFVGTANGGKGGNGGYGVAGTPIHTNGGEGGNGGLGGSVDITNTASLSTTGDQHHGIVATARGGRGGDGGGAAPSATAESGDAGNGGAGGSAQAATTASSSIVTVGALSYGLYVDASGGSGGNGGDFDPSLFGAGGNGGSGASGGSASAQNAGSIDTSGWLSHGMLVRSAGGTGGDGSGGAGLVYSGGGNAGSATLGGTADGTNSASGSITTRGDFAVGMLVQSVGGGGGDGGGAFGLFGGGGTGAGGNHGGTVTATNQGNITTYGTGAIGVLAESVGGGGGDGGGAAGLVSIGGRGGGGGNGGEVHAFLGGSITTGAAGNGNGAHGALIQSVGGGGGNGGYAVSAAGTVAVAVGGSGGTGGNGGAVQVSNAGDSAVVRTNGVSAVGILAQSVGGGGGNGGGAFALSGLASVAIGGSGSAAGNGGAIDYTLINADVATLGQDSTGILVQSVGGGGGNGGFAIGGSALVSVGVGGSGAAGGAGDMVRVTAGGTVQTSRDRSAGLIAQSLGGGGGNGGFVVGGSFGATVGVGGTGGAGGGGGVVTFNTPGTGGSAMAITTRGNDSTGLIVQSIGGGGGNGGFVGTFGGLASVNVGGSGGSASSAQQVTVTYDGAVDTFGDRSAGIVAQSIGGGGGNGGFTGGVSAGASVGIGGNGAAGGGSGPASYESASSLITTRGMDSAGLVVQSIAGGGGNGGFALDLSAGVGVSVGGQGASAGTAAAASAVLASGQVETRGDRSSAIVVQSIGGGGGRGGGTVGGTLGLGISVSGSGDGGGAGGAVSVDNSAVLATRGTQSRGIQAQSIGGGGGSGGFSLTVGGPALAVGGAGAAGGSGGTVSVHNSGAITTLDHLSTGLLAQSIGGGGGDGGMTGTGALFTAVSVGRSGGGGGNGGAVSVVNEADILTLGDLADGVLAQSIGGGGGIGGSASAVAAGAFVGVGVAVGGAGGDGRDGGSVNVSHAGNIRVAGQGSRAIVAQSVGGGGGNGGEAYSAGYSAGLYVSAGVAVSVGGSGGDGGRGGNVSVTADGQIIGMTAAAGSGGIVAQSIGGGGGIGGRASSVGGAITNGVSINAGVSVGGSGGDGGTSGTAVVKAGLAGGGQIETAGFQSIGILAQSIAGGGGLGGDSLAGAQGYGNQVTVSAAVTVGGGGGDGNVAGAVRVDNALGIHTMGDASGAIVAQSIGGGGGAAGFSIGDVEHTADGSGVNVQAAVSVGGGGGLGNHAGAVTVTSSSMLSTEGAFSAGITAQSIGGGGGLGGASTARSYAPGMGSETQVGAQISVAGAGGGAGNAAAVDVTNTGGILTSGFGSTGILAMAVGGGGGAAGNASAQGSLGDSGSGSSDSGDSGGVTVSIGAAIGLSGGTGGLGGDVSVANHGWIVTNGALAAGIEASSIGGGGGMGGAASAGATADVALGGAVAGGGGAASAGGSVGVHSYLGSFVWTAGENSVGILAQSIGGGGGVGGVGASTGSDGGTVDIKFSLGGSGADGGAGGSVLVDGAASILTEGANSHAILAQSIGGGGGFGAASGATTSDAQVAIGFALGGAGGAGSAGGTVHVLNAQAGRIETHGDHSYGIFAQSVGGGGGSAGAGQTGGGASGSTTVGLAIGGAGGDGSNGGDVTVDNSGIIATQGVLAHGVFAQSVGGGGGESGAASSTGHADMSIGGQIALVGGAGANGGHVTVNNDGLISTVGSGALGIFAQSVGGGGGYGGSVSSNAMSLRVGGFGGSGGNGGDVDVTVSGAIITQGAQGHGVVAQSVGGGGGYGGGTLGAGSSATIAIGGFGGDGGDGGNVTVTRTGTITTLGSDSIAIIAQSVGGGGGIGGAGFGRFTTDDFGTGVDAVPFQSPSGSKGSGGVVTIVQTGAIQTAGDRAHGVVVQSVGGGGGAGGSASLAAGQSGAGSQGGIGDAAPVAATVNDQIWVRGASAYALFGQSATGQGDAGSVHLIANGSLFAQGRDSVAVYAESTGSGHRGPITIDLNGSYTIGGSETGVAVMLVGGAANHVTNHSLLFAMGPFEDDGTQGFVPPLSPLVPLDAELGPLLGQFSPLAITGTSGDDQIDNQPGPGTLGRIIGNVDLGGGHNGIHNFAGASFVGLQYINLGDDNVFINDGVFSNEGIGVVGTVDLAGDFVQTSSGRFVVDVDLNDQVTDVLRLTGNGDFAGTMPLNFLSIDKLFTEYAVAQDEGMTDSGIQPTTLHPTVGFKFHTKVVNAADLVLYAERPSFGSMVADPASGVKDTGVGELADYMDGIEAAASPANPMARLINMLRFLPDEQQFGSAMMRLTPHYAVHSLDMINRSVDEVMDFGRRCEHFHVDSSGTRCLWLQVTPDTKYVRDSGAGTARRDDHLHTFSLGGLAAVGPRWSLGGMAAYTEFGSRITFGDTTLSDTTGEGWQAHLLARYRKEAFRADFSLGGGTAHFDGKRDTSLAQVGYIPGETLGGDYLPEALLPGIGSSVSTHQKSSFLGLSARASYRFQGSSSAYVEPNLRLDARWYRISGEESGSLAAMNFSGTSNGYYAATPGVEVGGDIVINSRTSLGLYANAGVRFTSSEWKIDGQFNAAQSLGAAPLTLTQSLDSPRYLVGAGVELKGAKGIGLAIQYRGEFGKNVRQNGVSAQLRVRF